jgi:hypothetical protein
MGSITIKMNVEFVGLAVWVDDTLAGVVMPTNNEKAKENIELVICEHLAADSVVLNPQSNMIVDTSLDSTWKLPVAIGFEDDSGVPSCIIELSPVTIY